MKIMFLGSGLSGFSKALKKTIELQIFDLKSYSENNICVTVSHKSWKKDIDFSSWGMRAKYIYETYDLEHTNEALRFEMNFFAETDGFVFVIDPRTFRMEASLYALEVFKSDLICSGRLVEHIPVAFLVNEEFDENEVCSIDLEFYQTKKSALYSINAETGAGIDDCIDWLLKAIMIGS